MASPVLVQSSVDSEMESLSRKSSYGPLEPLDMSKGLRRSPTIELLNQDKLQNTRTTSLVSLIAMSMKVASLPQVSIGSFFEQNDPKSEEVLREDSHATDEDYDVSRDSASHDEEYDLDHESQGHENHENIEAEVSVDDEVISDSEDEANHDDFEEVQDADNEEDGLDKEEDVDIEEVNKEQHDECHEVDEPSEDAEMSDTEEQNTGVEENAECDKDGHSDENVSPSAEEQMEEAEENPSDESEKPAENEAEMMENNQSIYRGPPPIEVAISFDTTGSMSSLLEPLRDNITNVCERLFADVPNLRISIIAHGDYCDEKEFYLMKAVDFTQDFGALRTFLNETQGTGGGDFAECYEYILNRVGQLSWTPGTKRALIMIGDAVPHEVDSPDNKMGLDWRQEVSKLYHQMGISVYSVQCKEEEGAETFWRELAERASGRYLQLSEFDNVVQLIMAICYREKDPMMFGAFEHEVRHNVGAGMTKDLHNMFAALRDGPGGTGAYVIDDAVPGPSHAPVIKAVKRKRNVDTTQSDSDSSPTKKIRKSPVKAKRAANTAAKKVRTTVKKVKKPAAPLMPSTSIRNKTRYMRHQKGRLVTGRCARERVPETRFLLGDQAWSPWKLAVTDEQLDSSWMPCRKERSGYRNTKLFKNNNRLPAVYEFAVQPAASRKRYPVYLRATAGFRNSLRCDTYFLRHKTLLDLVDDAVTKTYKVYVRRLVVKKPIKVQIEAHKTVRTDNVRLLSQMLFKEYDYAWNINKYASSGARPLKF